MYLPITVLPFSFSPLFGFGSYPVIMRTQITNPVSHFSRSPLGRRLDIRALWTFIARLWLIKLHPTQAAFWAHTISRSLRRLRTVLCGEFHPAQCVLNQLLILNRQSRERNRAKIRNTLAHAAESVGAHARSPATIFSISSSEFGMNSAGEVYSSNTQYWCHQTRSRHAGFQPG